MACCLCENLPTPLVKVGIEDEFGQSGLITPEKDELMEHFALSAADIAVSVKECIKKKESRAEAPMRVLVIGGSGLFGKKSALALLRRPRLANWW